MDRLNFVQDAHHFSYTQKPLIAGIRIYEVSRPRELPPQSLSKRCMNLSTHTASIKQPSLLIPISSGRTNLDLSLLSF